MTPERVVLVGFMGSGKTAVGALLARKLGWGFGDMDRWIEERTGLAVPRIFRERGEAFFREEERRLAQEIRTLREHVIAAGGGAFAVPETREALRAGAVTVWLRCDLETVLSRVPLNGSRPLASNRETIVRLFAERESSYRFADLAVETSGAEAEAVASRVLDAVFPGRAQGSE